MKQRSWRVVVDDTGRTVLEWLDAAIGSGNDEQDPLVERLDVSELRLESESVQDELGYDPYDSGIFSIKGSKAYDCSHGKNVAFERVRPRRRSAPR